MIENGVVFFLRHYLNNHNFFRRAPLLKRGVTGIKKMINEMMWDERSSQRTNDLWRRNLKNAREGTKWRTDHPVPNNGGVRVKRWPKFTLVSIPPVKWTHFSRRISREIHSFPRNKNQVENHVLYHLFFFAK